MIVKIRTKTDKPRTVYLDHVRRVTIANMTFWRGDPIDKYGDPVTDVDRVELIQDKVVTRVTEMEFHKTYCELVPKRSVK